jgi:hypothetical protein
VIQPFVTHVVCEICFNSGLGATVFWITTLVSQGMPVTFPYKNDKEINIFRYIDSPVIVKQVSGIDYWFNVINYQLDNNKNDKANK